MPPGFSPSKLSSSIDSNACAASPVATASSKSKMLASAERAAKSLMSSAVTLAPPVRGQLLQFSQNRLLVRSHSVHQETSLSLLHLHSQPAALFHDPIRILPGLRSLVFQDISRLVHSRAQYVLGRHLLGQEGKAGIRRRRFQILHNLLLL